jgi:hypothetical protein
MSVFFSFCSRVTIAGKLKATFEKGVTGIITSDVHDGIISSVKTLRCANHSEFHPSHHPTSEAVDLLNSKTKRFTSSMDLEFCPSIFDGDAQP